MKKQQTSKRILNEEQKKIWMEGAKSGIDIAFTLFSKSLEQLKKDLNISKQNEK